MTSDQIAESIYDDASIGRLAGRLTEELAILMVGGKNSGHYTETDLGRLSGDQVMELTYVHDYQASAMAMIAPSACEVVVQAVREAWSQEEFTGAVRGLVARFEPRCADLRAAARAKTRLVDATATTRVVEAV